MIIIIVNLWKLISDHELWNFIRYEMFLDLDNILANINNNIKL